MYGDGDLAEGEVFTGGFCNFGYWETLPSSAARAPRTAASAGLYRHVLHALDVPEGGIDQAVEVGAGRGYGAAVALAEYPVRNVIAIDQSTQQVRRLHEAQRALVAQGRLDPREGDAASLPIETASVDALYSVEALQHFPSKSAFVGEAARILRPGGRIALTTFFLTDARHFETLRTFIPTIDRGITLPSPIDDLVRDMECSGFVDVHVQSIGDQVFPGFDRWLEIIGDKAAEEDSWGRNWLKCYQAGLIDYHTIDASRSGNAA